MCKKNSLSLCIRTMQNTDSSRFGDRTTVLGHFYLFFHYHIIISVFSLRQNCEPLKYHTIDFVCSTSLPSKLLSKSWTLEKTIFRMKIYVFSLQSNYVLLIVICLLFSNLWPRNTPQHPGRKRELYLRIKISGLSLMYVLLTYTFDFCMLFCTS